MLQAEHDKLLVLLQRSGFHDVDQALLPSICMRAVTEAGDHGRSGTPSSRESVLRRARRAIVSSVPERAH